MAKTTSFFYHFYKLLHLPWLLWICNVTALLQYIPRNMHTVFALLCFVVVIHWLMSRSQEVKDFYYNKIIIIHRMTQRLKPIWIYLSHKFLPLYTLQRPHFGDNSVSTGASTEAVQPKKLRHNRHKLHWNRSTDCSATSDGKTDTTVAVPLQWTTMMPNIEV